MVLSIPYYILVLSIPYYILVLPIPCYILFYSHFMFPGEREMLYSYYYSVPIYVLCNCHVHDVYFRFFRIKDRLVKCNMVASRIFKGGY